MRILLVDDDTAVIQALLAILKTLPGHEVRVATTGEKGLENAAALGGVDLLISDVVMEPMDGFTLRDNLMAQYPEVRTIFITGYDLSDYPEQTANHQLLQKPIDADVLREAVAREAAAAAEAALAAEPVAVVPDPVVPEPVAVQPVAPEPEPVVAPEPSIVTPIVAAVAAPTNETPTVKIDPPAEPTPVPTPSPNPPAGPKTITIPSPLAPPAQASARVGSAAKAKPAATARPVVEPGAKAGPPTVKAGPTGTVVPAAQPVPAQAPKVVKATSAPAPKPQVKDEQATMVAPASGAKPKAAAAAPVARPPAAKVPTVAAVPAASTAPTELAGPVLPQRPEPTDPGELAGQLFGAYLLDHKIADGRWGSVYSAVQVSVNRAVGIEILDADKASDETMRDRFIADARAKAQVQHPSILAVYEAGEADGRFFYAHEYVDGGDLADLKASQQRLDEPTALKILRVAAEGLAYLCSHNIPHYAPDAASISVGSNGQSHLANIATHAEEEPLSVEQEIQTLGRIMLSVLPAIQSLSQGLRDLLKGMVQTGPESLTTWAEVLQGIKAIEPKVIPVEAAKISAQDRAAIAAVELARKQQKRALYLGIGSVCTLLILVGILVYWLYSTNERNLDEQVNIPAGEFLFAGGETKTLPEFWIDKYEVTYGQYAKFVKFLEGHPTSEFDDPRQPRIKTSQMHKPPNWDIYYLNAVAGKAAHGTKIDLNCPVMEVDFWDAYAYAKWKGRELPSEEEWEKAARGLKGLLYPWGEDFDPKKVNSGADYDPNHPDAKGAIDGYNYWNPVDKIKGDRSPFGVMGMAGNVREWTGTWDPAKRRPVVKGGSFLSKEVKLDQRVEMDANTVNESIGFRTVSHTPPVKK